MFPLLRLFRIIVVSLRYGLDELVLSSLNHPLATCLLRVMRLGTRPRSPRGQRLRLALESLGPIFVKFGQVLSTRRDLIPARNRGKSCGGRGGGTILRTCIMARPRAYERRRRQPARPGCVSGRRPDAVALARAPGLTPPVPSSSVRPIHAGRPDPPRGEGPGLPARCRARIRMSL